MSVFDEMREVNAAVERIVASVWSLIYPTLGRIVDRLARWLS